MLTRTDELAPDGAPWQIFTLRNLQGMTVTFMDWGATWLSAKVPLADGSIRETILGCNTPNDYLKQQAYLGATVGRYANRIANAYLKATDSLLVANQDPHQLHGGTEGLSHRRWQLISQTSQQLILQIYSPEGDQGFPGDLQIEQTIILNDDNRLQLNFRVESNAITPVALTQHAYFNLDAEQGDVRRHRLQINADHYQPVDQSGIPNAPLRRVANTGFDFRQPKTLAADFLQDADQHVTNGYDHAFLLACPQQFIQPAAILYSADNRLRLELATTEPALQCYSANFLAGTLGRDGIYQNYQGIALEPGYLPDSPNNLQWPQPSCWLSPNQARLITINYQFITE